MKAKDFVSVALGMLVVALGARYGVDLTVAERAHRARCEAVAQWPDGKVTPRSMLWYPAPSPGFFPR